MEPLPGPVALAAPAALVDKAAREKESPTPVTEPMAHGAALEALAEEEPEATVEAPLACSIQLYRICPSVRAPSLLWALGPPAEPDWPAGKRRLQATKEKMDVRASRHQFFAPR